MHNRFAGGNFHASAPGAIQLYTSRLSATCIKSAIYSVIMVSRIALASV